MAIYYKRHELYDLVDSISQDIEFEYDGDMVLIIPFTRKKYVVCYGETEIEVHSIDEVFTTPFINGKSLDEIYAEESK